MKLVVRTVPEVRSPWIGVNFRVDLTESKNGFDVKKISNSFDVMVPEIHSSYRCDRDRKELKVTSSS